MKRFIPVFFLAVLSLLSQGRSYSQIIKFNPKLDAVSEDEVKMTSYAPDTSAAAVVIYSGLRISSYLDPQGSFNIEKTHRLRLKILKESAKDLADFQMLYRTDGEMSEKIYDIKVTTYNWENGKVVKTKMGKDFIFDTKFSGSVKKMAFTAQNVKVGSVIEVSYIRKNKQYWNIGEIDFQGRYPVNCKEATILIPEFLKFNVSARGAKTYTHNTTYETKSIALGGGQTFDYNLVVENYKAVNVPAMKAESHLFCIDQFFSAVEYELRSIQFPGQLPKNFSTKWEDIDEQLFSSSLWTELNSSCRFKDEVDPIVKSDKSFEQKVCEIRNLVCRKVKWNKEVRLIPEKLTSVLKDASGDNADINALVGSALIHAGYTVYPVLIKLRSSGSLSEFQVSTDAFDTFVLKVISKEGKSVYLDAARDEAYLNVLPDNYLVPKARIIAKGHKSAWTDLTDLSENRMEVSVDAALDEDGLLTGKMTLKASNAESYMIKRLLNSFEKEDELYSQLEGGNSYTVISVSPTKDKEYSGECTVTVELEQQMQASSDMIYVKPIIESFHKDNYFKSEKRVVPIDIDRLSAKVYKMHLSLPEGYAVDQLPSSAIFGTLRNTFTANVSYSVSEDGRSVDVTYTFEDKLLFLNPGDYPDYRRFWQKMVQTENETIVLKKK